MGHRPRHDSPRDLAVRRPHRAIDVTVERLGDVQWVAVAHGPEAFGECATSPVVARRPARHLLVIADLGSRVEGGPVRRPRT
jgi:hypothetical protein